jgi:hypothetical protein
MQRSKMISVKLLSTLIAFTGQLRTQEQHFLHFSVRVTIGSMAPRIRFSRYFHDTTLFARNVQELTQEFSFVSWLARFDSGKKTP